MLSKGFTLTEVLAAISILTILAFLATVSYRPFTRRVDLQTTTQQLLATLHQARDKTLASEGSSSYGVYLAADRYVLFRGTAYNPSDPANETHALPANLELYDISVGSGSSVVFDRLEGTTSGGGSVGLRLIANPAESAKIVILATGQASLDDAVATTNSRLTDTRHVHLNLTWSIQNSTTLTLDFGAVEETVAMASFFNADRSAFDWEGTVSVNGADQTMRIHTHQLDSATTLLSIRRDRRFNTAPVEILIDGQQLISYAADGQATVGPFGGTMTVQ